MDEFGLPMAFGKQGKNRAQQQPQHELPPKPQQANNDTASAPPRGEPSGRGPRGAVGGGKKKRGGRRGRSNGVGGGAGASQGAEMGGEGHPDAPPTSGANPANLAHASGSGTDGDLSPSQSEAVGGVSVSQVHTTMVGIACVERGGASGPGLATGEGLVQAAGTHQLAHEAHSVAAEFNAGDKRPLQSSPGVSYKQRSKNDSGWGQPLGRGQRTRGKGGPNNYYAQNPSVGDYLEHSSSVSHAQGTAPGQALGLFKESYCEDPWKDLLQRRTRA